jgi:hypothetical protein
MGLMEGRGLRSADLIALATKHGGKVSARSLENWRYRGLLPRPDQQPGRAVWVYPAGTDDQLLRLLHWRQRTARHDLIRIALWVECFPVDLDLVREDLIAVVDSAAEVVERELQDNQGNLLTSIDAVSRKLAAGRGKAAAPRVARMSKEERERAVTYMLSAALGRREGADPQGDGLMLLERMMGLRRGKGWRDETVIPLPGGMPIPVLPTPEQARTAIRGARPEEFEIARYAIRMGVVWLPVILPQALGENPFKTQALLELAQRLIDELDPTMYALLTIAILISLGAKNTPIDELREHVKTLAPESLDRELARELERGVYSQDSESAKGSQGPPED